jgi:hypothetical protein
MGGKLRVNGYSVPNHPKIIILTTSSLLKNKIKINQILTIDLVE